MLVPVVVLGATSSNNARKCRVHVASSYYYSYESQKISTIFKNSCILLGGWLTHIPLACVTYRKIAEVHFDMQHITNSFATLVHKYTITAA